MGLKYNFREADLFFVKIANYFCFCSNFVDMTTILITDVQLFNMLKNKLGEKEAEAVTNYVKQEIELSNNKVIEFFNKDIESLSQHIDDKFLNVDEKFKTQEQSIAYKIEQLRSDTYKVVFWSSLVQILTIIGGIIALYKIFKP